MTEPAGALRVEGVAKTFRDHRTGREVHALRSVSFSVEPGESVGVIGSNGAGKSTLLKLAAGITAPTAGTIRRDGHAVAVIELGTAVHPDLSGRENLELLFVLSSRGNRPPDAAARRRIEEFSELGAALDDPVRQYSTGMLARLAFSVATQCEPDLFLLDEVLSVGDLSFQERCQTRIHELRSDGTTVVVVSHDLGLIGATCSRAVLLNDGAVSLVGDAENVIRQYQGLPLRTRDATSRLTMAQRTIAVGDQAEAVLASDHDPRAAHLRLELVTFPPQLAAQGLSITIGTAQLDAPRAPRVRIRLPTGDLPAGRYALHLTTEDHAHRILRTDEAPFTLVGPPGPPILRLDTVVELDGRAVEAAP